MIDDVDLVAGLQRGAGGAASLGTREADLLVADHFLLSLWPLATLLASADQVCVVLGNLLAAFFHGFVGFIIRGWRASLLRRGGRVAAGVSCLLLHIGLPLLQGREHRTLAQLLRLWRRHVVPGRGCGRRPMYWRRQPIMRGLRSRADCGPYDGPLELLFWSRLRVRHSKLCLLLTRRN